LQAAESARHNVIIRPRSTTATLIQLDDLDFAKADHIAPLAFIVFKTSPGGSQRRGARVDTGKNTPSLSDGPSPPPTSTPQSRWLETGIYEFLPQENVNGRALAICAIRGFRAKNENRLASMGTPKTLTFSFLFQFAGAFRRT
jgi:hypothetical protein